MFGFIFIALLIHIGEELPRFPAWATKHFGKTTLEWYLVSHAILLPLVALILYHATKGELMWIFLATSVQVVVFINGMFHLATTFLFKEYSPGLISSIVLTFPFSFIYFKSILERQVMSAQLLNYSIILGILISLLIIASLYLNMNLNFLGKRGLKR